MTDLLIQDTHTVRGMSSPGAEQLIDTPPAKLSGTKYSDKWTGLQKERVFSQGSVSQNLTTKITLGYMMILGVRSSVKWSSVL